LVPALQDSLLASGTDSQHLLLCTVSLLEGG